MRVAIASGKGGTGKTTIALNLALTCSTSVQLLDCDVEEPNLHLFFDQSSPLRSTQCDVFVPSIDPTKCTRCGACSDFCRFGAIAAIDPQPIVFPELCHGCGGCALVCPNKAITEQPRTIGFVDEYELEHIKLVSGRLNPGEMMAPPLIQKVKKEANSSDPVIIDAPPGSSCPMVSAVRDVDYLVLVAEPTPFGLSDLSLVLETAAQLNLSCGIVINRCDIGDDRISNLCLSKGIPLLAEIPNDRRIAEAYSEGIPLVSALPEYRSVFENLMSKIADEISACQDCADVAV